MEEFISMFTSDFAPQFIESLEGQRGGFDDLHFRAVSRSRRIWEAAGVCRGLCGVCVSAHRVPEVSWRPRRVRQRGFSEEPVRAS